MGGKTQCDSKQQNIVSDIVWKFLSNITNAEPFPM